MILKIEPADFPVSTESEFGLTCLMKKGIL